MTSSPIKLDLGQLSVESSFMSFFLTASSKCPHSGSGSVISTINQSWAFPTQKAKKRILQTYLPSAYHVDQSSWDIIKPSHGLDFTTKQAWVQIAQKTAKAPPGTTVVRPRASSPMCRTCIFLYAKQYDNSTPISGSPHDPSLWFFQLYMERFQLGSSLGLIHAQMTTRTILFWILKMISTCLAFHLK